MTPPPGTSLTRAFASSYGWNVRTFVAMLVGTAVLGAIAGHRLAGIKTLEVYKLMNIVGLCYSLLAVVVLSEVLMSMPRWKEVCIKWLAPSLLWANTTMPLGVFIGGGGAWLLHRGHSAAIAAKFGFLALFYGAIVGSLLEATVVMPKISNLKSLEVRWRMFGLILLMTGILAQLVSAIESL